MQAWGQSTAPAKAFLNVLPQNSPLLLGLPAETSGVLLQASDLTARAKILCLELKKPTSAFGYSEPC